jgi:hypothetical protein
MTSSPLSTAWRLGALAPAGVGLAVLVALVQIRMDAPWGAGVLLAMAAVPALLLLADGLAVASKEGAPRAAATVLLVAGLVLAAVTIARLAQVLGDDEVGGGGTLTWTLALFTAIAAYCYMRSRSVACLLLASLAAVALLLAAVNWVFDTEDVDTYRALLAFSFVVLFGAGLAVAGRAGTVLVGAAGVTVVAASYALGLFFLFLPGGASLGWGWELVTLVQGLALLAYAALRFEPGPAYLAFFVLVIFVTTAAVSGGESGAVLVDSSDGEEDSPSLVGWPLALAIATAAAAAWGTRTALRER